jgi:hypothetical protein
MHVLNLFGEIQTLQLKMAAKRDATSAQNTTLAAVDD